jgi:Nuclease-related domain
MAGKRHEGDRACRCHQPDMHCAGLRVRRLSSERVRELAEEIWTASTGSAVPAARSVPDPRSSHPGGSARAAYQRHRQQERDAWRRGWRWRAGAVVAAAIGGGLLIGLTVGAWLGWSMGLLAGLLTGWRLRCRPAPSTVVWRRQAAAQRRTAGALEPLEREGYLVLHDVALPGWPASLDHLVVGASGIWVIESSPRGRPRLRRRDVSPPAASRGTAASPRGLSGEVAAIADTLGGSSIPVQPLLCVNGARPTAARRSLDGIPLVTRRQLAAVISQGPPLPPNKVQRVTAHALELLRPAV